MDFYSEIDYLEDRYESDELDYPKNIKSEKERFICCCKHFTPHSVKMKFKLYSKMKVKKENLQREKIENGILENKSIWEGRNQFPYIKLYGRNEELQKIFWFLNLNDSKLIQISGKGGIGKTALAKQLANYFCEKMPSYEDVIYEDLEKVKNVLVFNSKLKKSLILDEKFCEIYQNRKILFIFDHCDLLFSKNAKEISRILHFIINKTKYLKFLIISEENYRIAQKNFKIEPLDCLSACKLLLEKSQNSIPVVFRNLSRLSSDGIFSSFFLSPRNILMLGEFINNYLNFNKGKIKFLEIQENQEFDEQNKTLKTLLE